MADPPPPKPAAPRVVRRAEPPPDTDGDTATATATKRPAPKLTPEEARALLAVTAVNRASPLSRAGKRGGIAVVPVTLLSIVFELVLGDYALAAILIVIVGALAWTAWPLLRRSDWD